MKYLFLIILFFSFLSCGKKNKELATELSYEGFTDFLAEKQRDVKQFNKIVIIPGSGCTGCISEAEDYFTKHYKDKSSLYIFTAIGDIKIFKIKFPDQVSQRMNVIVDADNEIVEKGFHSVYPSLATLNEDQALLKLTTFEQ